MGVRRRRRATPVEAEERQIEARRRMPPVDKAAVVVRTTAE